MSTTGRKDNIKVGQRVGIGLFEFEYRFESGASNEPSEVETRNARERRRNVFEEANALTSV